MHLCIFVLVSPLKVKTMICLKNRQNNNSLSEQFLLWPPARPSSMHGGVGGKGGGDALNLGVECAIMFRLISDNQ